MELSEKRAEKCPYLNNNGFCVITKAGAGCRISFCANEGHLMCKDYLEAENWTFVG